LDRTTIVHVTDNRDLRLCQAFVHPVEVDVCQLRQAPPPRPMDAPLHSENVRQRHRHAHPPSLSQTRRWLHNPAIAAVQRRFHQLTYRVVARSTSFFHRYQLSPKPAISTTVSGGKHAYSASISSPSARSPAFFPYPAKARNHRACRAFTAVAMGCSPLLHPQTHGGTLFHQFGRFQLSRLP
jgi:hypothetical protein